MTPARLPRSPTRVAVSGESKPMTPDFRADDGAVKQCGGCPELIERQRTDIHPPCLDYWCRRTGEWLGFIPVRSKECKAELNRHPLFKAQ